MSSTLCENFNVVKNRLKTAQIVDKLYRLLEQSNCVLYIHTKLLVQHYLYTTLLYSYEYGHPAGRLGCVLETYYMPAVK